MKIREKMMSQPWIKTYLNLYQIDGILIHNITQPDTLPISDLMYLLWFFGVIFFTKNHSVVSYLTFTDQFIEGEWHLSCATRDTVWIHESRYLISLKSNDFHTTIPNYPHHLNNLYNIENDIHIFYINIVSHMRWWMYCFVVHDT